MSETLAFLRKLEDSLSLSEEKFLFKQNQPKAKLKKKGGKKWIVSVSREWRCFFL